MLSPAWKDAEDEDDREEGEGEDEEGRGGLSGRGGGPSHPCPALGCPASHQQPGQQAGESCNCLFLSFL